jgi:hypothetical protein
MHDQSGKFSFFCFGSFGPKKSSDLPEAKLNWTCLRFGAKEFISHIHQKWRYSWVDIKRLNATKNLTGAVNDAKNELSNGSRKPRPRPRSPSLDERGKRLT